MPRFVVISTKKTFYVQNRSIIAIHIHVFSVSQCNWKEKIAIDVLNIFLSQIEKNHIYLRQSTSSSLRGQSNFASHLFVIGIQPTLLLQWNSSSLHIPEIIISLDIDETNDEIICDWIPQSFSSVSSSQSRCPSQIAVGWKFK